MVDNLVFFSKPFALGLAMMGLGFLSILVAKGIHTVIAFISYCIVQYLAPAWLKFGQLIIGELGRGHGEKDKNPPFC